MNGKAGYRMKRKGSRNARRFLMIFIETKTEKKNKVQEK